MAKAPRLRCPATLFKKSCGSSFMIMSLECQVRLAQLLMLMPNVRSIGPPSGHKDHRAGSSERPFRLAMPIGLACRPSLSRCFLRGESKPHANTFRPDSQRAGEDYSTSNATGTKTLLMAVLMAHRTLPESRQVSASRFWMPDPYTAPSSPDNLCCQALQCIVPDVHIL